jgi:hypothetical protein
MQETGELLLPAGERGAGAPPGPASAPEKPGREGSG